MLADEGESVGHSGSLDSGVHRPREWLSSLVKFISDALPGWRDDPKREAKTSENELTTQLCGRLNSLSRHSPGWDILQFRREEPDEADGRRSIDLVASPSGHVILIGSRTYNEYQTLLPIECKRLPTPTGKDRDEREYLISKFSSTGGVHRFKAGHHGASHARAVMIGYVQDRDVAFWQSQIDAWIESIVGERVNGWSIDDKLALVDHNTRHRLAALASTHGRQLGLKPIHIDHLWIEM
ncbi:hypothetical protein [Microvirga sp. 2TAF3]|uniref:hypothetical protein n=1 Tax=Microvirga sp. 2TAF3 TaxID=3233014 RepID=UPI003F970A70